MFMCGFNSLNSGEARYLSNSLCQSEAERGGRDPVTGFHSVMLNLQIVRISCGSNQLNAPRFCQPRETSECDDPEDGCCAS